MTENAPPEVTRALYDALFEARPFVAQHEKYLSEIGLGAPAGRVHAKLEAIDGALADAAEYLTADPATPTRRDADE